MTAPSHKRSLSPVTETRGLGTSCGVEKVRDEASQLNRNFVIPTGNFLGIGIMPSNNDSPPWVSDAYNASRLGPSSPLVPLMEDNDQVTVIDLVRQSKAGHAVPGEFIPRQFFVDRILEPIGDLCVAGFLIVSERVAHALEGLDLGGGNLSPIEVFQGQSRTALATHHYCLFIGSRKTSLQPAISNVRQDEFSSEVWRMPWEPKHQDVAVRHNALQGADLWVDPSLANAFFVSERGYQALCEVDAASAFKLTKCRLVD